MLKLAMAASVMITFILAAPADAQSKTINFDMAKCVRTSMPYASSKGSAELYCIRKLREVQSRPGVTVKVKGQ